MIIILVQKGLRKFLLVEQLNFWLPSVGSYMICLSLLRLVRLILLSFALVLLIQSNSPFFRRLLVGRTLAKGIRTLK